MGNREELRFAGNIAWGRGSTQGLVNGRKLMMPFSFDKVAQACQAQVDSSNADAKFCQGSYKMDGSKSFGTLLTTTPPFSLPSTRRNVSTRCQWEKLSLAGE